MTISERITHFRKLRNMSQQELANKAQVSIRMINHYENKTEAIPIDKFIRIATALDISIAELAGEVPSQQTSDFERILDIPSIPLRKIKKLQCLLDLPDGEQATIFKLIDQLSHKSQE